MSSISARIAALKQVGILAFLGDDELATLANSISERTFKKGEVVFEEGSTGSEVYVVVSGKLDIQRGGQTVAWVMEGQIVGEMAAVNPERRSATIVAHTDTVAYVLTGFDFRAALQSNPKMAMSLIKGFVTRLRKAETEVVELRAKHAGEPISTPPPEEPAKKKKSSR
jgi:CRP-like cAMP-binding protein